MFATAYVQEERCLQYCEMKSMCTTVEYQEVAKKCTLIYDSDQGSINYSPKSDVFIMVCCDMCTLLVILQ
ncbi:hypothetical protein EG68_10646 [Paragonimus skrjabini miyazakii]|uniref:Apple domain-containing protein n=1 Tax=Paragonimus skrjabini miyazakii TaxID=59628 RepID=A0A8S9YJD4_9TREM|nr:hypothetical protein EG68_10646 [Paragonimus skrjabini miyazakii]